MTGCDEGREVALSIFMNAHYLLGTLYTLYLSLTKSCKVSEMNFYFYRHGT